MSDTPSTRPIRLHWSPEAGRLVEEPAARSGQEKLGGAAVHAADLAAREALFAGSSERLTGAAAAVFAERYGMNRAGNVVSLPVRHDAGDKTPGALDESWRVMGVDSDGDVILSEGAGILGRLKQLQDPIEATFARQTGEGAIANPHDGRDREDRPVEDDGRPVYIAAPGDLTAAQQARKLVWEAEPTDDDRAKADEIMRGWAVQAEAEKTVLDAQLNDWANDPRHPANGGDGNYDEKK